MSSALLPWQEDFRRECGIRRGVILHGNTGDLTSDPEAPGQWTALPTALMNLLRQRGSQSNRFHGRDPRFTREAVRRPAQPPGISVSSPKE